MTLTMLPPCVGAYLSFVGSEEPYAWCRVEFCGRFHAHEGAQSEVGEGHERAGDAAGAEGAVELLVADDRHDGGAVEAGFDAFGLPCAAVAAAQVDLAWQPYVEAGDVAVFVFVADGHGRADPVVAPVPYGAAPVGGAWRDPYVVAVAGDGHEAASVRVRGHDGLLDFHAERVRRDEVVHLRLEGFGRVDAFEHGKVGERADGFVGPADHWFGEGFHGRWDAVGDAVVVVVGEVVAGAQGVARVVASPLFEEFVDGGLVVGVHAGDGVGVGAFDGEPAGLSAHDGVVGVHVLSTMLPVVRWGLFWWSWPRGGLG